MAGAPCTKRRVCRWTTPSGDHCCAGSAIPGPRPAAPRRSAGVASSSTTPAPATRSPRRCMRSCTTPAARWRRIRRFAWSSSGVRGRRSRRAPTSLTCVAVRTGADGVAYEGMITRVLNAVRALDVPVVGLVDGPAVGGGLAILACCDLVYATPQARFGAPVARTLGNCVSPGTTARLRSALGRALTTELLLTGRLISAEQAHAAGFIRAVVPAAGGQRTGPGPGAPGVALRPVVGGCGQGVRPPPRRPGRRRRARRRLRQGLRQLRLSRGCRRVHGPPSAAWSGKLR